MNLFQSLIDEIQNNKERFDLVIIGGDTLHHRIHDFDSLFRQNGTNSLNQTKRIFEEIKNKIKEKLNLTNILYIPGNNDYLERYNTPQIESLVRQTNTIEEIFLFENYLNNKEKFNMDFLQTILNGFYYTYELNINVRLVIINTVFFSIKNSNIDENKEENLAFQHLNWIDNQINQAKNDRKKVIILGHIPNFINYYHDRIEHHFKPTFLKKFNEIIFKHKDNILYFFASHVHLPKIGIRVNFEKSNIKCNKSELKNQENINQKSNSTFISTKFSDKDSVKILNPDLYINNSFYQSTIMFPSLSPIFGNNPGYSIIEFDIVKSLVKNVIHKFFDLNEAEKFKNFLEKDENKFNDDILKNYVEKILSNKENPFNDENVSDLSLIIKNNDYFGLNSNLKEKKNCFLCKKNSKILEENNKNIILRMLWSIKFNYRKDFGFTDFDNKDFGKFVFSRLYKNKYLNKYLTFNFGINQMKTSLAVEKSLKNKQYDIENGLKNFRSSFYKSQEDDCYMGELIY